MKQCKYILNEAGEPVAVQGLSTWAEWFESSGDQRRVGRDQIGDSLVSTVFLSLDHSFGDGPPILWETLVIGGKLGGQSDRCAGSREQAEAMHVRMVARVKAAG